MRVTQSVMAEMLKSDIQRNLKRLQESQEMISSGKRILSPSDDPSAVGRLIGYKVDLSRSDQILKDIDNALVFLNTADSVLADAENLVSRAREIAIEMASDTVNAQDRIQAADEIRQIKGQLIQIANTSVAGQYIFGGTKTTEPPYEASDGKVVYRGNSDVILRQIGSDETIRVNVPGHEIFGNGEVGLFKTLSDLERALTSNDIGGIRDAADELKVNHETILSARAKIGGYSQRVQFAKSSIEGLKEQLEKMISQIEDVDLAEASIQLARNDNAYKASLLAAARLLQSSLLDFLG
ncbi:flagellar hook-associated protein FlgL [Candidatus Poribacteria bacterium]|nr:flagellar hook-associated protein FlgL [Candidatus Poribacteria bacterium]